ncbi:MAG: hypothetical protein Q4E06_02010 [Lautropia sp.]|nr:hypothetical protein [Lautropia sp.]
MEEAEKLARCSDDPHPSGSQTKGIHHDSLIFFSSAPPLFLARAAKNSGVSISYQDALSLFIHRDSPALYFQHRKCNKAPPLLCKKAHMFHEQRGTKGGRRDPA